MSGIISKDGTIQLGKSYLAENGTIDYIIPGDYSIQILDVEGQILINVPFSAPFEIYIDPITSVETGVTGFAFTIPYPEEAFKIKIQYKDEVLTEFNPSTKLLYDAVDLIPNYGFVNNPEQRGKTLHHKIDAVEKIIEENNIKGAIQKLEHDIKDKIKKWLVDDYQKENPEQLSKVEIIELIDEIIYRLSLMIKK